MVCRERFRSASVHNNLYYVRGAEHYRDFQRMIFSEIKQKNAGRFRQNAGRKAKCAIFRIIAGWLTMIALRMWDAIQNLPRDRLPNQ